MPRTSTARTTPGVGAEVADLAVALERTLSWLRRAVRPAEWSAAGLSTLEALHRLGPQRITDLVARERISQPGMTGLIARLEAAGLVTRRPDPTDGRAALVEATPAGSDYLRALHRRRAEALAEHMRRLAPGQREALIAATAALEALAAQPLGTEGL